VAAGKDVPESLAVGRALQAMRRADVVVGLYKFANPVYP
jgi:hypothetical protein